MKALSTKLTVETLEDRCVPSTLVEANFNNDDYMDKAELTSPTTITVSLANPDGSYTVSATLSIPNGQYANGFSVGDRDGDGNLDIGTSAFSKSGWFTDYWLGNGDGTFGNRQSHKINLRDFRGF